VQSGLNTQELPSSEGKHACLDETRRTTGREAHEFHALELSLLGECAFEQQLARRFIDRAAIANRR